MHHCGAVVAMHGNVRATGCGRNEYELLLTSEKWSRALDWLTFGYKKKNKKREAGASINKDWLLPKKGLKKQDWVSCWKEPQCSDRCDVMQHCNRNRMRCGVLEFCFVLFLFNAKLQDERFQSPGSLSCWNIAEGGILCCSHEINNKNKKWWVLVNFLSYLWI